MSRTKRRPRHRFYGSFRGGNMVMAPSACGLWSDERPWSGPARKMQRRTIKRGERQNWRQNIDLGE